MQIAETPPLIAVAFSKPHLLDLATDAPMSAILILAL